MDSLRINNDVNGNPRIVIHFFEFLTGHEKCLDNYNLAKIRAKNLLGAKVYHGKRFRGGFVCQAWEDDDQIESMIKDMLKDKLK